MANLPHDVIIEILSRLPAKSLIRFRCVCKPWRNLIFDSTFIELHFNRSIQLYSPNLLFSCDPNNNNNNAPEKTIMFKLIEVDDFFNKEIEIKINDDDTPLLSNHPCSRAPEILGSCNGIVCAMKGNTVTLVNPCTREYKLVTFEKELGVPYAIYGFGYDAIDDDYKVVQYVNSAYFDSKVNVFSLNDTSLCLTISTVPYKVLNREVPGIFLNGALHWLAQATSKKVFADDYDHVIISIDMRGKMVGEIRLPDDVNIEDDITMGVLGGQLCVLCNFYSEGFEIWTMKSYGVRESWFKLLSFEKSYLWPLTLRPLYYYKGSEVLLSNTRKLYLYYPKQKRIRNVKTRLLSCHMIGTHFPSLVALKSGTYLGTHGVKASIHENRNHLTSGEMDYKEIIRSAFIYLTTYEWSSLLDMH